MCGTSRRPLRALMPVAALVALTLLTACGVRPSRQIGIQVAGGSSSHGKVVIEHEACGSCHEIPGIPNARGLVGPPLTHWGGRSIIAGVLPNNPQNLEHWVQDPQSVVAGNAMPNMGISTSDARDIAAYLFSIK